MNVFGWVLLPAVAVVAAADVLVATRGRRAGTTLGPSAALVLLAAFAWLAHAEQAPAGRLLLLGLLAALATGPLPGPHVTHGRRAALVLGSVVLARVLLSAAVLVLPAGRHGWGVLVTLLVVALVVGAGGLAVRALRGRAGSAAAATGVTAYGGVVLALLAAVWWHGPVLAAAGLTALAAADGSLGWSRWARRPGPAAVPVASLALRHVGTALVVFAVVRPDLPARPAGLIWRPDLAA